MVKVKGLFKKPWSKDIKALDKPPTVVRDSYSVGGNSNRESTYDYYEDPDARMSAVDRMSMMDQFKQASLYFDYQLSNRNLGVSQKQANSLRVSTGVVHHNRNSVASTSSSGRPERRLQPKPAAGRGRPTTTTSTAADDLKNKMRGRNPMRISIDPMLPTMEEGDEEEDSVEEELLPRMRTRSQGPKKGKSSRPGMARRNSWSSSRELDNNNNKDPKRKIKKKELSSKSAGSAKSTGSKKKTKKGTTSSRDRPKTRSAAGTRKRSKSAGRNRSSSAERPRRAGNRPGLARRNSWSSSTDFHANTGQTAARLAGDVPGTVRTRPKGETSEKTKKSTDDGSGSPKKSLSANSAKKKGTKKRGEKSPTRASGDSKKKPAKRENSRNSATQKEFMAGLRKSRAIAHSISLVANMECPDAEEMNRLQEQLKKATEETMRLKEAHDKEKEELGRANEETDELQQMLTASAKENMDLWEKLEAQAVSVREMNEKAEETTKQIEKLQEEKAALAETVNKREEQIRSLESSLKLARLQDNDNNNNAAIDEIQNLKETNLAQQKQIDEHQKELQQRDAKIESLGKQLQEGPQGDETRKVLDLTSELDAVRAEMKQSNLDHSIEVAKHEAMVAKLQNELSERKSGIEKEQDAATSLKETLAETKDKLNAALAKLETTNALEQKVQELECRVRDAETMESGLQGAIDKWTDKAFMWQEKAEELELQVAKLQAAADAGETTRSSNNSIEENIQSVFGGMFGSGSSGAK